MTPAQFATHVRLLTNTNSAGFTDAQILALMNTFKDDLAKEIIKVNENYFCIPMTTDLVLNQREYAFPDNLLGQIKLAEAKLDGTNWKRLIEVDYNLDNYTTDNTTIKSTFQGKNPAMQILRNSIWILNDTDIAAVTAGLKIHAFIYPADFSSMASTTDMAVNPSTTTFGWPRQFHELLARRVIIEYKGSRDIPIQLTQKEQNYYNDLQMALDSISLENLDRETLGNVPSEDGFSY